MIVVPAEAVVGVSKDDPNGNSRYGDQPALSGPVSTRHPFTGLFLGRVTRESGIYGNTLFMKPSNVLCTCIGGLPAYRPTDHISASDHFARLPGNLREMFSHSSYIFAQSSNLEGSVFDTQSIQGDRQM